MCGGKCDQCDEGARGIGWREEKWRRQGRLACFGERDDANRGGWRLGDMMAFGQAQVGRTGGWRDGGACQVKRSLKLSPLPRMFCQTPNRNVVRETERKKE